MTMSDIDDADRIRRAGRGLLSAALADSRAATLRTFAAYERALRPAGLRVPCSDQVNPPLWELGHVGWFQEFWIGRNAERSRGPEADPQASRPASCLPDADALYDSSRIEHARRWQLPLPDATATRDYLERTLDRTREILAGGDREEADDAGLRYFGWLTLMHEDMHHEAAVYMAQALDIDPGAAPAPTVIPAPGELAYGARTLLRGARAGDFAFDNELAPNDIAVEAFRVDRTLVPNAAFEAFVEDDGYLDERCWTAEGWAWRLQAGLEAPRYWRRGGDGWQRREFGRWVPLVRLAPVLNLSLHEAQAWCRWAGRRLPTEAEWELAATVPSDGGRTIDWGQAWEWTASPFQPYPSFVPHPYRDYSQPWFGTRQVLRGASFATRTRLRHPRYRNFFTPERNDIFAGFRSCAPAP
jgi:gamma-glutamyl hercynylcysteine S-oxide synthase